MKACKLINHDGTTRKIILKKDNGAYNAFTPKEAAQAIELLKRNLWRGLPLSKEDMR